MQQRTDDELQLSEVCCRFIVDPIFTPLKPSDALPPWTGPGQQGRHH